MTTGASLGFKIRKFHGKLVTVRCQILHETKNYFENELVRHDVQLEFCHQKLLSLTKN